jgi:hypothetical protein
MDFWTNPHDKDRPTDRLERDPLSLTLEDAQAEYFADMAFDDRLLALLDTNGVTSTTIDITHTTTGCTDKLTSQYFSDNTSIENYEEATVIDAYAYHLSGVLKYEDNKLAIDARIDSEVGDYPSVQIQNDTTQADCFYMCTIGDEFDVTVLDTKELFTVLCQLAGATKSEVNSFLDATADARETTPFALEENIEGLWSRLGETHGKTKKVQEIIHEISNPQNPDAPEKIKLHYEELENPDASIVELYLEHSIEMIELDAQESYCLSLKFEQVNKNSVTKGAEKVIISGSSPRLIAFDAYKKANGRVTPLDVDDTNVRGMFVDWFDELISA